MFRTGRATYRGIVLELPTSTSGCQVADGFNQAPGGPMPEHGTSSPELRRAIIGAWRTAGDPAGWQEAARAALAAMNADLASAR